MGRLHIAAVECHYQEVNRQLRAVHTWLKQQYMLEMIKELTATKNNDHITRGGILAWAKRVEAQRPQAAVLNMVTESRQFDKIKISKRVKDDRTRTPVHQTTL